MSSVDCDQEDGDQNGEDDATGILSTPVKKKKKKIKSRNEDVVETLLVVKGVASTRGRMTRKRGCLA